MKVLLLLLSLIGTPLASNPDTPEGCQFCVQGLTTMYEDWISSEYIIPQQIELLQRKVCPSYSKVSNKRGTTAIYFWKKSTHCVLIRYAYFTKFKKIPSKCSDFLSGNTNSFEISVYLLHFTLLRLFIAWDLSSTTFIRCTTVIRYFRVRGSKLLHWLPWLSLGNRGQFVMDSRQCWICLPNHGSNL